MNPFLLTLALLGHLLCRRTRSLAYACRKTRESTLQNPLNPQDTLVSARLIHPVNSYAILHAPPDTHKTLTRNRTQASHAHARLASITCTYQYDAGHRSHKKQKTTRIGLYVTFAGICNRALKIERTQTLDRIKHVCFTKTVGIGIFLQSI